MAFTLPKLPYEFSALEPHIDARTMEIHYTKHHNGYVTKLNTALEGQEGFLNMQITDLLKNIDRVPEEIRQSVINNGGGHANHTLFWETMSPNGGGEPSGDLATKLNNTFGSFEKFKEQFSNTAAGRFGSGWAWLVLDNASELHIMSTANQDSPLMENLIPILGLDVWEHAYYLKYQNMRAEYIEAWWNVVDWSKVSEIYVQAKKS